MISFPKATVVGRILPKEVFYTRLNLSRELKDKFVSDIQRIRLEYSLTATTLNLEPSIEMDEILILGVDLKKKDDFDYRIVENIARQNQHKIVFLLRYKEEGQLVVYHGKVYKGDWFLLDNLSLEAVGFTLMEVWNGFLEQIALGGLQVPASTGVEYISVDERLKRQDSIIQLEKEIDRTERLARSEKQPKRRFELAMKVQELQRKLNDMREDN